MVTYFMVPASKRIARKIGAVDYPGNRRLNSTPVPRCGGIALYTGFMAACATIALGVAFFNWEIVDIAALKEINLVLLFGGISFMFIVGLIDDISQLSPFVKFSGQVVAATIVAISGISIELVRTPFGDGFIELGLFDYPITVLYLVIFVNITNLIDGLDGLATGIVAIVAFGLLYLITARGGAIYAMPGIILVAVCLAFLRFNFSPASIFMGDSGSLFLGLLVGIISLAGLVRTQSVMVMLVPLVMAGIPLVDTLSAIVRRLRAKQPIQQADSGHLHHRLLDAGWSQRKSVLVLYLCSAVLAVIGCFFGGNMTAVVWKWVIVGALAAILFLVIWRLGLFSPVLKHYFDKKGERGPRKPKEETSVLDEELTSDN